MSAEPELKDELYLTGSEKRDAVGIVVLISFLLLILNVAVDPWSLLQ